MSDSNLLKIVEADIAAQLAEGRDDFVPPSKWSKARSHSTSDNLTPEELQDILAADRAAEQAKGFNVRSDDRKHGTTYRIDPVTGDRVEIEAPPPEERKSRRGNRTFTKGAFDFSSEQAFIDSVSKVGYKVKKDPDTGIVTAYIENPDGSLAAGPKFNPAHPAHVRNTYTSLPYNVGKDPNAFLATELPPPVSRDKLIPTPEEEPVGTTNAASDQSTPSDVKTARDLIDFRKKQAAANAKPSDKGKKKGSDREKIPPLQQFATTIALNFPEYKDSYEMDNTGTGTKVFVYGKGTSGDRRLLGVYDTTTGESEVVRNNPQPEIKRVPSRANRGLEVKDLLKNVYNNQGYKELIPTLYRQLGFDKEKGDEPTALERAGDVVRDEVVRNWIPVIIRDLVKEYPELLKNATGEDAYNVHNLIPPTYSSVDVEKFFQYLAKVEDAVNHTPEGYRVDPRRLPAVMQIYRREIPRDSPYVTGREPGVVPPRPKRNREDYAAKKAAADQLAADKAAASARREQDTIDTANRVGDLKRDVKTADAEAKAAAAAAEGPRWKTIPSNMADLATQIAQLKMKRKNQNPTNESTLLGTFDTEDSLESNGGDLGTFDTEDSFESNGGDLGTFDTEDKLKLRRQVEKAIGHVLQSYGGDEGTFNPSCDLEANGGDLGSVDESVEGSLEEDDLYPEPGKEPEHELHSMDVEEVPDDSNFNESCTTYCLSTLSKDAKDLRNAVKVLSLQTVSEGFIRKGKSWAVLCRDYTRSYTPEGLNEDIRFVSPFKATLRVEIINNKVDFVKLRSILENRKYQLECVKLYGLMEARSSAESDPETFTSTQDNSKFDGVDAAESSVDVNSDYKEFPKGLNPHNQTVTESYIVAHLANSGLDTAQDGNKISVKLPNNEMFNRAVELHSKLAAYDPGVGPAKFTEKDNSDYMEFEINEQPTSNLSDDSYKYKVDPSTGKVDRPFNVKMPSSLKADKADKGHIFSQ